VLVQLLTKTGRARLRAAVGVMPSELAELVENDLWRPADADEWNVLLDEIDDRHVERLTLPILRAAAEVEAVKFRALALASLAGDEDLTALYDVDTSRLRVDERIQICAAIGARSDPGWLERFATLKEDVNPRVRAAYLVAGFRLGDRRMQHDVETMLADPEEKLHVHVVAALCAAAHDPAVAVQLETRLLEAEGDEKTTIATALSLDGHLVGRTHVRAALSTEPPPGGALAVRLVRALRRNAGAEDLEVFQRVFPVEDDRALDRELVLGLMERGDAAVMPILRAGMWNKDFDLSVLASGVFASMSGTHALIEELKGPPPSASSGDLRRVGFALGEWCGVEAVESLARELRYQSGHPALQGALLGVLSTRTQ
jgi:hypothetical protein